MDPMDQHLVAVERLSLLLWLWDQHLRWNIVSIRPRPWFASRLSSQPNLGVSRNRGWHDSFYSTDVVGCYCFNPNADMETRMRYGSVEDYLEELKESTTYISKDIVLSVVQLLGGSRWNPPYVGVVSWEDTEGGSLISQSNTLVEVT